jgi:2-polyprenyl-6-methoxyphenol hydroxylase-like FAD-dependent oxidoreductase
MADALAYDVAVVGASLAGCTAARLFAQQGLRVALVEQHADLAWHKRMCTHYIQACAAPTIRRLGLEPSIEAAGGVRSRMEIWTRWGWIRHAGPTLPETLGYSIRRQTLDPLVRRLAAETPGVELHSGWTAERLLRERQRIVGVALGNPQRNKLDLTARLVVGADGRSSPLGKLAEVPLVERPNNRFATFAYYRNLPLASGDDSKFWMLDPDAGYALPNDDGLTLLCSWITKDKLSDFQREREGSFERFFRSLPDGPDLARAQRVSEIFGALDLPVLLRTTPRPGFILIGDASLAADPLWGVGCGWAFQSAEWLVDYTAAALKSGCNVDRDGRVDRALRRYFKRHKAALGGHYVMIAGYARGRRFSLLERLIYSAAAQDPKVAETVLAFGARRAGVGRLLAPTTLARAVWHKLGFARPRAATPAPLVPVAHE